MCTRLIRFALVLGLVVGVVAPRTSPAAPVSAGPQDSCAGNPRFLVGAGMGDITGPAAEVGMMGYGQLSQQTDGIHQRLRSRAFVIASPCNGRRVAFVSADLGMIFQGVKTQVVEKLRARFGDVYSDENVLISATHTHSGPGGYSHHTFYNLSTFGFVPQNFDAIVSGIVTSISRAHSRLGEGTLRMASGELLGASRNRSPEAYRLNPAAERARYALDVDTRMTLLRMTGTDGRDVGLINWFAVHATSMGNTNHYISGDNKGLASYLFEKAHDAGDTFVAAFAQSNEGDVTPNVLGGTNGGGADDFEDTEISARRQFDFATQLWGQTGAPLTGGVDYRHTFVKMDAVDVAPAFTDGQQHRTCPAAIGLSMIAGAEDGPGYGVEGASCSAIHDLWGQFTCALTTTPCQGEKPIVLEMGSMKPHPWTPNVLPFQLVTVGPLALVGVPFEMTTMSGRRLRQTVLEQLAPKGITDVIIAGLSNDYAGYVATREEYARQDYEGASTHFGPWTLAAIQQGFDSMAASMREGKPVSPGPTPPDLRYIQASLQPGVVFDDKLLWVEFGDVLTDAKASYGRGDTVSVTFWGAHPKNDLRLEETYLRVQRKGAIGAWVDVADDSDWETRYRWERENCVPTLGCSHVTVDWDIPRDAAPGTYRILHEGEWKSGWDGRVRPYYGASRAFTVK